MSSLKIRQVRKTWQGERGLAVEAIAEVSLEVSSGEFVAILGPSGCPHCSQVPAIALPDFKIRTGGAVTLRGTLSYGFKMDALGNASMLRLEKARVATGLT